MNFTFDELVSQFTLYAESRGDRGDVALVCLMDLYRSELKQVFEASETFDEFLDFFVKETTTGKVDPLIWYLIDSSELLKAIWNTLEEKD